MADLINLADYREARTALVEMARNDLDEVLRAVDLTDAYAIRRALEATLPDLVQAYGAAVASVAADRYDALRDYAGVPGRFNAVVAEPVSTERILAKSRWAITPAFGGGAAGIAQTVGNLALEVDEYVKEPGRLTVVQSVEQDPALASWARVPSGPTTCAFCLVLASRGPVYGTKQAAQFAEHGGKYHGDCDCEPTPVWNGDRVTLPPDYDEENYLEVYRDGIGASGSGDFRDILAGVRKTHPSIK